MAMWSGNEGVQYMSGHMITCDLHPCSQRGRTALVAPGGRTLKNKSLLFLFFGGRGGVGGLYSNVSFRNTSTLACSCHNRHEGEAMLFFLGQGVGLYFRPLLRDENLNIMMIVDNQLQMIWYVHFS